MLFFQALLIQTNLMSSFVLQSLGTDDILLQEVYLVLYDFGNTRQVDASASKKVIQKELLVYDSPLIPSKLYQLGLMD